MWIGLVCGLEVRWGVWVRGEVRCVDRRCKTVNRRRKTHHESVFGLVIGLAGSVIDWLSLAWPRVSWIGCICLDRCEFVAELSLTVGLCLAWWSDYRKGEARLVELSVTRRERRKNTIRYIPKIPKNYSFQLVHILKLKLFIWVGTWTTQKIKNKNPNGKL